jgi:hypothetical protein
VKKVRIYLGGGNGPDLVVVGSHEEVGNTGTHHAHNPLIEVLGLGVGNTGLKGSIDHAINALDLLGLGQHGDVVLEGVGNPLLQAANVGDTLVGEPILIPGESLVDAVIEVLVVGEDNVATDIVQLWTESVFDLTIGDQSRRTKPSGVTSVEARPPGVSLESMMSHEALSCSFN